ncbi:MAG: nucleoside recognition domain-containing protein [Desulfosalsimonas sp.]|uniref:nucleoside recognition domain-containing protein n=1 Tax=Desulfosalsimonas sp. TaxID=3073848 RepID=UPI003970C0FD
MNVIFFAIVMIAFLFAAGRQVFSGPQTGDTMPIEALSQSVVDSAAGAVELAIGLIGVMTLFLGLMKVAEKGGLLNVMSRLLRPVMVRLFPDVPADHPAMGAMILNISANALGLGNAATPFGIRAMQELDTLNAEKGTATNAMALFLAINTSSITLLPTGVIALRAAAGSGDPAGILPTTLFATLGSTLVAITATKLYQRFSSPAPAVLAGGPAADPITDAAERTGAKEEHDPNQNSDPDSDQNPEHEYADMLESASAGYPGWVSLAVLCCVLAIIPLAIVYGTVISPWIIPGLVAGFLAYGMIRGVRVYEVFVEGAKEGFYVAVKIIPYLVAILVAVGMFRASGALEAMVGMLGPVTGKIGLPAEALPMALLRPLSGSGAYGVLASIINDPAVGPDSYIGYLVSTFQGSTETTFYVLAVYFGAVQVRRVRHTMAAALTADLAGIMFAVLACTLLLA